MKLTKPAIVNTKSATITGARAHNKMVKGKFAAGTADASKAVPAHQKSANLADSRAHNMAAKEAFCGDCE
jgi:hypothetical protein